MLDKLMKSSLENRLIVLGAAIILFIFGAFVATNLPIDVFPDLTAPTVTIMTEAHGMAPEEVETMVTFPIETAVNGATGVRRVRSTSIQGFSTVLVEFDWGTDIYRARQIVNEKLQTVANQLPEGVDSPTLAPVTSIMGEIMMVGLTSDQYSLMDLRSLADFEIRRRLLAIPGVANVKVYGGLVKQYQVRIYPERLRKYNLSIQDVLTATEGSNLNASGGYYVQSGQEYIIRGIGRIFNLEELKNTVVAIRDNIPVLLQDVGEITIGPKTPLGTASINQNPAVLIVVSKQPDANTLELTSRLEAAFANVAKSLPVDVKLHDEIFKQSDFIRLAINNVLEALVIGAVLAILILLLFLGNLRITFISVLAIPFSLIAAILFLKLLNLSINTMTLGGMAIAIGILVDDAIIYVENVYRRLRENNRKPENEKKGFFEVILAASREIRVPITMATFIIIVVFLPLFFLSGIEGRMLRPLGISYGISVFASLLVAVTITPALSYLLLKTNHQKALKEVWLVRKIKAQYLRLLQWSLNRRTLIVALSLGMFLISFIIFFTLGRSFLPEFNEGTFNISVATVPGTALEESDKIGLMAEKLLLSHPAVTSVARRTGRTELDEHSLGSHAHELEVKFRPNGLTKEELTNQLREKLSLLPGCIYIIGQPISHRIDHMLSGTRANIAIKLFGPQLDQLRSLAHRIKNSVEDVPGLVDLSVDQQIEIPQVKIKANRQKMAIFGLTVADLEELIDVAFLGHKASEIYEGQNQFDLVVRYAEKYRDELEDIRNSLIDTPTGARIPLSMVADIRVERGPNYINRENVQRKIVIQANVSGRDLLSVVNEVKAKIEKEVPLPPGYFLEFGGQFESAVEASRMILLLSLVSILAIFIALYAEFRSIRRSLLIMLNLPLALIGGIFAIAVSDGIISIASMVGLITLFGIAVRNGIMLLSHITHLKMVEGLPLRQAIIQGSLERLNPVLMTALTTGLALLPLALGGGKPGSEIQTPMSIVILGGLLTATFLNMIVIPVLFEKWGFSKAELSG
ncbi:MAG: efflux RND transporter permease subunit [Calditrichia bacterium]